ncbi:MAG: hypothetical protein GAK45_01658 [Pseudomonas citronellolis]|nr:MAG: hypothetical protein GAK45_01658 [Pseudomonas citronellolis]
MQATGRFIQGGERVDDRYAEALADHGAHRGHAVGFDHGAALDPGGVEGCIDLLPVAVHAGQVDEGLALEVLHTQAASLQQRMPAGQHAAHVGAQQQFTVGTRRRVGVFQQAEVEALAAEAAFQFRGFLRAEVQADARVAFEKRPASWRQQVLREDRQATDAHLALFELAQRLRGAVDTLQSLISALHLFVQGQRLGVGQQAPALASEQRHAEYAFQARQFAADGGLRGEQQARGSGDAAGLHDGAEDFDMADGQFHRGASA